MPIINKRSFLTDYLLIITGTTLLALAINVFFDKLGMVIGGVTGIAIVLKELTQIPIWATNLVVNIPLFIIGVFVKGGAFGKKSIFATLYLSLALFLTETIPAITQDILLGGIFGGILAGLGLGMVFLARATTGGTDMAASIIQHYFKYLSVAKIMMLLDGIIIGFGFYVFGPEKTLYALISIFITIKVIDALLEGLQFAKAAFIISEKEDEISAAILGQLDRGLTGLNGTGMYTGNAKKVLLCVVSQRQIIQLKDIVKSVDKNAFVIVADVREVLGEGFLVE